MFSTRLALSLSPLSSLVLRIQASRQTRGWKFVQLILLLGYLGYLGQIIEFFLMSKQSTLGKREEKVLVCECA